MSALPYRNYLLAVLMFVFGSVFAERLAFGLLLQDIKIDLGLTDTQLGLITGIAFALFYSAMGLPIARWADRANRVVIIALGAIFSGIAVTLCGTAATFSQLALMRIGVAVGEAGCIPPAHSLLADNFTRAERPRAAAMYKLGGSLSLIIGYVVTGWLNATVGWRITFLFLGLPSIALGGLVWLTLKEPRSRHAAVDDAERASAGSAAQVFKTLWSNNTFRSLLLAFAVAGFFNTGIGQWEPTFFIRSFGMTSAELGIWFGACVGVGGALGTFLGGELATRFAPRDEQRQLQAIAVCYSMLCVFSIGKYLAPDVGPALVLTFLTAFGGGLTLGPLFALMQTVVPARMRATAVAILYLSGNLIGLGFGPLAVGALSDALSTPAGNESLRWSLLAFSPGYLWCTWQVWRATRTVGRDIQSREAEAAAS